MLKQRVITAIILVAIFLSCLFVFPPAAFHALVLLMMTIAAWEFSAMAGLTHKALRTAFALSVALLSGLGVYMLPQFSGAAFSFFSAAVVWWALALLWVQGYPASAVLWQSVLVRTLMGFFTLIPAGVGVLLLFGHAEGQWLVLALILLVAAADTGAYFSGKAFGRRKLALKVSPGKTWEGVAGGLIIVACCAALLGFFSGIGYLALIVALPAAAVSVLGDLFESMLKRHCGMKDSGTILPGHGGVLDRIDGVTAAAPMFVLALLASGWTL